VLQHQGVEATRKKPRAADAPGVGLQKGEAEHAWSRVARVSSTSGSGGILPVPL
jgi:hypothetical protein